VAHGGTAQKYQASPFWVNRFREAARSANQSLSRWLTQREDIASWSGDHFTPYREQRSQGSEPGDDTISFGPKGSVSIGKSTLVPRATKLSHTQNVLGVSSSLRTQVDYQDASNSAPSIAYHRPGALGRHPVSDVLCADGCDTHLRPGAFTFTKREKMHMLRADADVHAIKELLIGTHCPLFWILSQ
jgi:hypothetical protein